MQAIPHGERRAVGWLFGYSMLLAGSYTLSRTVGDSLFLSRIGNADLAWVFLVSGLATAIAASSWYWLTAHLPLGRALKLSSLTFATLSLSAWWLLPTYHHAMWLIGGIYLLAEIKGCVSAVNIVSALNETLGGHSSKQSWARVGLGAPMAGIVVGVLVSLEAEILSLRTWLLITGLLDLMSTLPAMFLSRVKVAALDVPATESDNANLASPVISSLKRYACSRQFQLWIGVLISTKVIVLTLISFEWKTTVNNFFGGDESGLTMFFGTFYAVVGMATLLVQALVTGRVLQSRSLYLPILLMPVVLLSTSVVLLLGSGLMFMVIATTVGKSMEIWRRSVHDTTLNRLYTKIERKNRRRMIAINNTLVKPMSEVSASAVLLLTTIVFHRIALLSASVVWLAATLALIQLVRSIRKANADLENPVESQAIAESERLDADSI